MGCQDHYGVEIAGGMCQINNFAYRELITDQNGLLQSGDYQGEEVNQCSSTLSIPIAQIPHSTTFTRDDVAHIRDLFGAAAGSGDVFLDGSRSQRGIVCVNMSREQQTRDVIQRLIGMSYLERHSLFANNTDAKFDALLETLQTQYETAYRKEPPLSNWDSLWRHYGKPAILGTIGLGGVAFAFGVAVPWLSKWLGPRGGGHGGGLTGGGGGRSEPVRAPAPETATDERTALEMNSTAILVGGLIVATAIAGIFHVRGRAREVRNGEVRVREAAEVRVRDLAAQAPVARPRVEAREATTGGGIDFFEMLRVRPLAH